MERVWLDQRGSPLLIDRPLGSSARLPPAIPTEVLMRWIGLVLTAALVLSPLAVDAQQPAKMPTVAVVSPGAGPGPLLEVFYRALREAGYIEDKNIVVARHYMSGREDQYDQVMTQLDQQKVDVIAAIGPPAALAARRTVKSVPVVFSGVGDPVVIGLVKSLAAT